ncbi:MAG: prolyl oligopeptidase family serine peptidase [Rhodospirillaceae bacterium]|jgi:dienelactone hydrolase|nr:prolyl oligopeptidase family serine peptidase [Rhodospirillaceae bacterium]MBT5666328.1 prolyl oligopeptidase family serine peptidase [Rhodospirillaceae bacterium]
MRIIKASDLFFFCLVLLLGAGIAVWLRIWNPDTLLHQALPLYQLATRTITPITDATAPNASPRAYHAITLANADGGSVNFTVSLPGGLGGPGGGGKLAAGDRLPTLVVLTGLRAGRRNLDHIPNHGRNAIVAYDYPFDPEVWKSASAVERAWIANRVAHQLPDEVAGLIAWVRQQSWADPDRVSLVGVSLGAVALPVIQRRATNAGHRVAATVIAYGGANLHALARANLKDNWIREPLALLTALLLRPLAPVHHLPHLNGPFLLIHGADDDRIPQDSVDDLTAMTPEPKTIIVRPGAHIDNDRPKLIRDTIDTARDWLTKQRLLEP